MPVAVAVRGEQDQVVVAARLVVVDPSGLLEPALRRDVHLAADDRLHAVAPRLLRELDRAEHVAVVRDRARRHAGGLHARHELLDLVGAVEQRELRVQMQVDEGHRPEPLPSARRRPERGAPYRGGRRGSMEEAKFAPRATPPARRRTARMAMVHSQVLRRVEGLTTMRRRERVTGLVRIDVDVARPGHRARWHTVARALVDSGSEMTWL